jgi:ParB family transcriptional regulator, chromosome partitioning protein
MKRKALGKGLSALLPEPEPPSQPDGAAQTLPIDCLEPNPSQPRTAFEAARLEELASSIRESGMIQPILARKVGGRYQIIAGERRWRAAQHLGMTAVPVLVRDVPDSQLLELALVENIQRQELSPLEEAQAYQRLQDDLRLTQEEVAKKVGKDRSTIANTVRLLRLPREVRTLLGEGKLSAGIARAILAIETAEEQIALAREVVRRGLSVREVERRVALARTSGSKGGAAGKDANTRAAEERLRAVLGTRVEIVRRGKSGHLRIQFAGEAELNRVFELITKAGRGRG